MKKIVFCFILLLCLVSPVRASENQEKVKVYLFWSNSCHNCHNLMKSLSKVKYNYFEIVTYRTDNNKDNAVLANKVAELVGETPGYVPLVVIGDSYHILGWNEKLVSIIPKEANSAYQSKNYTDIVAELIEKENMKNEQKSFEEALKSAGIRNDEEDIIAIIILISSLVLLSTSIILKRKNLLAK